MAQKHRSVVKPGALQSGLEAENVRDFTPVVLARSIGKVATSARSGGGQSRLVCGADGLWGSGGGPRLDELESRYPRNADEVTGVVGHQHETCIAAR